MTTRSRGSRTIILVIGLLSLSLLAEAQISLVHVTACGGPAAFPSTTCTIPSTGTGNLLVIGWGSTSGGGSTTISSITDNAGNIYAEASGARAANSTQNDMGDIWYAKDSVAGATVLTITPNPSGASGTAVIWEFAGADQTAPLDQAVALDSQAASATPSGAPVTTTAANELIVSVAWVQGTVNSILSGNVFTNDSTATGNGWAHYVASVPGTHQAQWSSTLGTYASSSVSFKGAAAGASACDLNADGVVNVVDVQKAINMDLGLLACPADLSSVGCNSSMVQDIVNAALGEGCSITVSHSVSLSWTASASASITGYNVYRSTTSGGPYTKLSSSSTTSFSDGTVVGGQSYYYVVTAVDSSNIESGYSNQAQATVPST